MYQYCSEKQISTYLDNLYHILSLDKNTNVNDQNFNIQDIEYIFSIIALQTEHWLQENDITLNDLGAKLNSIYETGAEVFISRRQWRLLQCIEYRDVIRNNSPNIMYHCFERLHNSYLSRENPLNTGSLIQSIAQLYTGGLSNT